MWLFFYLLDSDKRYLCRRSIGWFGSMWCVSELIWSYLHKKNKTWRKAKTLRIDKTIKVTLKKVATNLSCDHKYNNKTGKTSAYTWKYSKKQWKRGIFFIKEWQ